MSQRGSGKARKSPASKASVSKASAAKKAARPSRSASAPPARKGKGSARADDAASQVLDAPSLMARVIRLESERDRLQSELGKAEVRIRALEEGREQVVNRIDWVIDSLRGLLEDQQ